MIQKGFFFLLFSLQDISLFFNAILKGFLQYSKNVLKYTSHKNHVVSSVLDGRVLLVSCWRGSLRESRKFSFINWGKSRATFGANRKKFFMPSYSSLHPTFVFTFVYLEMKISKYSTTCESHLLLIFCKNVFCLDPQKSYSCRWTKPYNCTQSTKAFWGDMFFVYEWTQNSRFSCTLSCVSYLQQLSLLLIKDYRHQVVVRALVIGTYFWSWQ